MLWSMLRAWLIATTVLCAFRPACSRVVLLVIGACELLWMCIRIGVAVCLKGRSVLDVRESVEEPECLRDPALGTHEFVTFEDGITLHYVSAGEQDKPLVLLLHGFPDSWYTWHKQIVEFKKHFWVVALDMRGYGQSAKPNNIEAYQVSYLIEDVKGLLKSLGRGKASLVGHDWGAVVSWCFANCYPHMVDRLVTINGGHPDAMRHQLESSLTQMIRSRYMVAYQCPIIPEAFLSMDGFTQLRGLWKKGHGDQEISALQYTFSKPGALTAAINYYRAVYSKERQLKNTRFRQLNVPTLVLWGYQDPYLTPGVAELSRRQSAQGCLRYIRDAGHWPQLEHPSAVNEVVAAFLASRGINSEAARPRLRRCRSSL